MDKEKKGKGKRRGQGDRYEAPELLTKKKIVSTTTNAAVSSFFAPKNKSAPDLNAFSWREIDSMLFGKYKLHTMAPQPTRKIAAFDLDGTLICTKSNTRFAKDENDWQWWHHSIPGKLRSLHASGYDVLILTNQAGIKLKADSKRYSQVKLKVAAAATALDIPLVICAATAHDLHRKPRTDMWEYAISQLRAAAESSFEWDEKASFFIGDAAGRKSDFSCSDRKFAANIGIPFQTPEQYFLGAEPEEFSWGRFNPSDYDPANQDPIPFNFVPSSSKEIILCVGCPGCGKSSFSMRHIVPHGYTRINQDNLKCLKKAKEQLACGNSVIVGIKSEGCTKTKPADNTNADRATRKYWIDLARAEKAQTRCLHFTASEELCRHNNLVRALSGVEVLEARELLPNIAFSSYTKRFEEPTRAEGFEEIIKVDFAFTEDQASWEQWKRWWE